MAAMLETVAELLAHERWADRTLYAALAEKPSTWDDKTIRYKLNHIHKVQNFFAYVLSRTEEPYDEAAMFGNFDSFEQIRASVDRYHRKMTELLSSWAEADMGETVVFRFPKTPERPTKIGDALLQLPLHGHGHRAQILLRMRDLELERPGLDLIGWAWAGKPDGPGMG